MRKACISSNVLKKMHIVKLPGGGHPDLPSHVAYCDARVSNLHPDFLRAELPENYLFDEKILDHLAYALNDLRSLAYRDVYEVQTSHGISNSLYTMINPLPHRGGGTMYCQREEGGGSIWQYYFIPRGTQSTISVCSQVDRFTRSFCLRKEGDQSTWQHHGRRCGYESIRSVSSEVTVYSRRRRKRFNQVTPARIFFPVPED